MLPNKLPHDVMTYHINITLISGFKNSGHWEKKCDELLTRFNRVKNQKSNKLSFCLVAKKKKKKGYKFDFINGHGKKYTQAKEPIFNMLYKLFQGASMRHLI